MKSSVSPSSITITVISVMLFVLAGWLMLPVGDAGDMHHDEHAHHEHEEEVAKGPHGGRLLVQDDFSLEISIYETGLPPEFRVYAYKGNRPVAPGKVTLDIELKRLGDKLDRIQFTPQQDYLRGDTVIYEPHSFEASVNATHQGKSYSWQYDNPEGRTLIPGNIAQEMGIRTETVGPVTLTETRTLTGRVQTNPNRLSRVRPRFAGVVIAIRHELGDVVRAGDILATVQSNESLQDYHVKAPINGMIVKRDVQVGEATGNEPLFIIADLSEVWVELDVFVHDLDLIKKGQAVMVESLDGNYRKAASIDWVSPLTAHASQSVRARVIAANEDGALRPGQFIRGRVTVAEHAVSLAVRQAAVQRFRDFQVVFARFDDVYEVRMLELGRQNHDWVEVLGGIEAGTQYVTENSYLIKADIEKSGASHDH